MPPTMVAMKAKRTTLTPSVGETVPVCAVRRIAATPASRPESANANAITVSARTPRIRAIRKSSAAARICLPMVVPRRSEPRQSSEPSVTPTMTTSSFWIESEPTSTVSPRAAAKSVDRGVDPHVSAATFWSRKLSANDVISSVAGLALRTGRKATRSHGERERDDDHERHRDQEGVREREQDERERADHDQLAVGEVDQAHDPEDERDPEREERIEASEGDRVDRVLEHELRGHGGERHRCAPQNPR